MRDLERYNRNIRNENRTSISTGKGEPKLQEGNEGDIRINSTKGGVKYPLLGFLLLSKMR